MAVKIKLQRKGRKKQPTYRVVVQDSKVSRDGKIIEILGTYNPSANPDGLVLKEDKVKEWIAKGALPTDPVRRLISKLGLIEAKKFTPKQKAQEEAVKPETKEATPSEVKEVATETLKEEIKTEAE